MRKSYGDHRMGGLFDRFAEGRGPGRQGGGRGSARRHPSFGRMGDGLGRMLGHGDLRFVILALLEEKPRHGYEIIKALEEKSSGHYTPSPGVIYPTLTFLEEGGFASVNEENKKKLYTITDEGKVLLNENREFVDAILGRFSIMGQKMSKLQDWFGKEDLDRIKKEEGMHSIRAVMHELKAEMFSLVDASSAQKKQIAEILERTIAEIRKLKG